MDYLVALLLATLWNVGSDVVLGRLAYETTMRWEFGIVMGIVAVWLVRVVRSR